MMSRSAVSAGRWMCCWTRRTSRSPISWWPIATSRLWLCEAAEPPLTPTMTSRTCSPHISSAVDTADDIARAHALGRLMADADHPQSLAVDAGHETNDLAGTDIERRNHTVSCLRH